MYLVICPACRHTMQTSFARVGAVAPCPACGRRFQIQPQHIQRRASRPGASLVEPAWPAESSSTASRQAPPPPRPTPEDPPQPATRQPVAPTARPKAVSTPSAAITPTAATTPTEPPASLAGPTPARRARRRAFRRQLISLLVVLGAVLVVTVLIFGGIWLLARHVQNSSLDWQGRSFPTQDKP